VGSTSVTTSGVRSSWRRPRSRPAAAVRRDRRGLVAAQRSSAYDGFRGPRTPSGPPQPARAVSTASASAFARRSGRIRPPAPSAPTPCPSTRSTNAGSPPPGWRAWTPVAAAVLRVTVIPHLDDAEGGTHDTRYCYLDERRLRQLEDQLADDSGILRGRAHRRRARPGHPALDGERPRRVTLRRRGRQWTWPSGTTVDLDELRRVGRRPPRPLPGRRRRRGRSRCAAAAGGRPRRGYTTRNANRQVATLPTRSGCPPQPRAHGKTNSPAETPRKLKHRCGFAVIDQQQRLHDRVRALGFADLGPDDPEPEGW
jgi:hypothetical protein